MDIKYDYGNKEFSLFKEDITIVKVKILYKEKAGEDMSRFQLKFLAVVTMLIDHTGAILFPNIALLRVIGRFSFPIFAFLIADGLLHTSSVKAYLLRLFAFACISEIPFDLAFFGTPYHPNEQNVFFTLFLGLAAIAFLDVYLAKNSVISVALAGAAALLAELLHTDYGWFGVAAVIVFYCFRRYRTKGVFLFSALNTGYGLMGGTLQIFAAGASIPILLYNGTKGKYSWKYFFYAFYPVHLLLLFFIHMVVK